jgi:hypothetical protein
MQKRGRPAGSLSRQGSGLLKYLESQGHILPDEYLVSVYLDENAPTSERVKAAAHLMPYCHRKLPVAHDLTVTGNPIAELLEEVTRDTLQLPCTRRDQ